MRAKPNRKKAARRKARRMPPLPRFGINWRALLVPPLLAAGAYAGFAGAKNALDGPVERLVVEGSFQRVSAIQVQAAVADELERGFLSLDLAGLRRRVEALDWVDGARISRQWPGGIHVRVTEHRAAARWGDGGLLNVRGELFTRDARYAYPELPSLDGPPGSERQVAEIYLRLRGRLAAAHLSLERLRMDARGALEFVLAGGQQIRVGRREVDERLARFFEVVAPALANDLNRVSYVDLRYTNGFAVGWVEPPAAELAKATEPANRG